MCTVCSMSVALFQYMISPHSLPAKGSSAQKSPCPISHLSNRFWHIVESPSMTLLYSVQNYTPICQLRWCCGQTRDLSLRKVSEWCPMLQQFLGLYSLSGRTSYRMIAWSLEAARFGFSRLQPLQKLTGTSSVGFPRCLSNFRAIRWL